MKCPYRYKIRQASVRNYAQNDIEESRGEIYLFEEIQDFGECFKEECMCWNKTKECCEKKEG